jgi:thioredoxin reductase (NADPH)
MNIATVEDEQAFRSTIKDHKFTVVDFFSTDCPPCEKLAPVLERLAGQYQMIKFVRIWRQQNRPLAESFNVTGSPTLLFFHNGELQEKRLAGDISEVDFKEQLDYLLLKENISQTPVADKKIIGQHDLCIIGTGPAGYTASIYASRYKIDHVIVGEMTGGLMSSSHKICNYPSEIDISGMDLTRKMHDHALQLGAPHFAETVISINKKESWFEIELSGQQTVRAKTVILATGTRHKHLGLGNEENFTGLGISYCATCDAMFYKNKTVAVIGGSDSANTASLYLAEVADKVYQIYRGEALRGETAWIDQIHKNPKIELILNTNITGLIGDKKLEAIELDQPYQEQNQLKINGLFVEIGSDPDLKLIQQLNLQTDEKGFIQTGPDQTTSQPGIWAAGDITTNSNRFRQIVTACSEGAIAAENIFKHLQKSK